jgi:hypothetical protein
MDALQPPRLDGTRGEVLREDAAQEEGEIAEAPQGGEPLSPPIWA